MTGLPLQDCYQLVLHMRPPPYPRRRYLTGAGVLTLPRRLGLQQAELYRTFTGLAPVHLLNRLLWFGKSQFIPKKETSSPLRLGG